MLLDMWPWPAVLLRWRPLADLHLPHLPTSALQCFSRAKDLGGLLLLHSSHGDAAGMDQLATLAGGRFIATCMQLCNLLAGERAW